MSHQSRIWFSSVAPLRAFLRAPQQSVRGHRCAQASLGLLLLALLSVLVAGCAGGTGATTTGATTTSKFTEFPLPDAFSKWLAGITQGPDGNLWFTEGIDKQWDGKIGRITPAGAITEFALPTPSADPRAIAAGPDGNLWFTEGLAAKIGRITPSGVVTEFPLPGTGSKWADQIAAGPDGNVWFTAVHEKTSVVGRITPGGAITEFPLVHDPDPAARWRLEQLRANACQAADGSAIVLAITAGPDGNLWVGEYYNAAVARVTPSGAITEFPVPDSAQISGITSGPDGNVWFTLTRARIGRCTPAGDMTIYRLPGLYSATAITAGPDGNLWFTSTVTFGGEANEAPPFGYGAITPSGAVSEYQTPSHSGTYAISPGPNKTLWFTELDRLARYTLE